MKKIIIYLLLISLLFIPMIVYAEECGSNNIKIKSIDLEKLSDNVEELSNTTIENNKIKLDLKMYDVGDYAEYKLKLENISDENYYFDMDSIVDASKYMEYSIIGDKSNIIKPNNEKEIYFRVTYKNEIEDDKFMGGKYQDSSNLLLDLSNQNNIIDILTNPETNRNLVFIIFIFIILITMTFLNKKKRIKLLLLTLILLLPISVYAVCKYKIELESNVTVWRVKPTYCTFDGELTQGAEYVNGQYTYHYMQESGGNNYWSNINHGWGVVLTDNNSTDPVTTPLCTYINDIPVTSMSYMFYNTAVESIDFSSFETTNITNMNYMFAYASAIKEIDLSKLNTANLKTLDYMFYGATSLEKVNLSNFIHKDIQSFTYLFGMDSNMKTLIIDNWEPPDNVSAGRYALQFYNNGRANIENIYMRNWKIPESFEYVINTWYLQIDNVDNIDVSNWDLSDTKSIYQLFKDGYYIKHISGMNTWDTSSITNIGELFKYCYELDEADLSSFDYSKVTNVSYMFELDHEIKTIKMGYFNAESLEDATRMFSQADGVENIIFDSISTPKLKITNTMFHSLPNLKSLDLRGMDTSHVIDMNSMFSGDYSLKELDLSTLDTNDSQSMSSMFFGCNNLVNAYAKSEADATRFNNSSITGKPAHVNFVVGSF